MERTGSEPLRKRDVGVSLTGFNLSLQRLSRPEAIRDAVGAVLGDANFAKNMAVLQALQEKYEGPGEVTRMLINEVESLRCATPPQ